MCICIEAASQLRTVSSVYTSNQQWHQRERNNGLQSYVRGAQYGIQQISARWCQDNRNAALFPSLQDYFSECSDIQWQS